VDIANIFQYVAFLRVLEIRENFIALKKMSKDKKKPIYLLSILLTIILLIITSTAVLYLMQMGYSHQFKADVMMQYEILLAFISIFSGITITYFFGKIRGKDAANGDTLYELSKENDVLKSQFLSMQYFCKLCFIEINSDLDIINANENAEALFSRTNIGLYGSGSLRSIVSHEDLSDDVITDVFNRKRDSAEFTFKLKQKDSRERISLQGTLEPVLDEEDVYKVQILLRDMTYVTKKDEKISELEDDILKINIDNEDKLGNSLSANEKLRYSIRLLSDTFIAAPSGLVVVDKNANITNFNRAAENLFDYHEKDVIGKSFDVLYTNRNSINDFLLKVKEGDNIECEVDCLRSDLSHFVGMLKAKPVFDDKHNVIRYVLSINDITKKTKLEKFILLKNQELLSVNEIFMSTNQFNSLNKKLNVFLDKLFDNLEIVRKGLFYLKNGENSLELYVYKGFHYFMLKDLREIEIKGTLCGHSLETGKVMLSETFTKDEAPDIKDMLKEHDISHNHIYLPVAYKDRALGVLIIFPNKNYHFDNDDMEFFNMLKSELGICVKQALKYEELKKKVLPFLKTDEDEKQLQG
jgi:PAS domain S-box-containing protein